MTTQGKTFFFMVFALLLMIATRGHNNWFSSIVHLPDFTLPALMIAGVYFRTFWVAFILIIGAVAIDNVAIIHQGVSTNCITPAYSILPLSYYGVFWAGRYLSTLTIDNQIIKNLLIIIAIITTQWLIATTSYYAFTAAAWAKFPVYIAHWSVLEIPAMLYWMAAVMIISTTLALRILPTFTAQKSVG